MPSDPSTEVDPDDALGGPHALVIAVGDFRTKRSRGDEAADEEASDGVLPALPFARPQGQEIADVLRALGHRLRGDGLQLDIRVADMQRSLYELADAHAGTVVIHIISHGILGRTSRSLYVAAADTDPTRPTTALDIEHVLRLIEDSETGPHVLILLDVCHAGAATRHWVAWADEVNSSERRAWVIGGAAINEWAYYGRFSTATAKVLRRLHQERLPVHPSDEFVPLPVLVQEIERELAALDPETMPGPPQPAQQVSATLSHITGSPQTEFFRNPRYEEDEARRRAALLDIGVRDFVASFDSVLDPGHYIGRALAHPGAPLTSAPSLFSGRRQQLQDLADWLCGQGPRTDGLRMVIGSPGAGKSTLLGVMVCLLHPEIRTRIRPVALDDTLDTPASCGDRFAAVHARGQSVAQVVQSIHKQLGLTSRTGSASVEGVLEAIRDRFTAQEPAIVIVDALDEAAHPPELLTFLLLPLGQLTASATKADATAGETSTAKVCRLIVGTRPLEDFEPLFETARRHDGVLDLDAVPESELRADVAEYVGKLLQEARPTRPSPELARAVADAVVERVRRDEAGPFLVAALYMAYVTTASPHLLDDPDGMVAEVPTSLGAVLEMHLAQLPSDTWLRPVLAAVAAAKDTGTPARLVGQIAASILTQWPGRPDTLGPVPVPPEPWRVEEILDTMRFYLRRSPGPDSRTHYRLFHQGLADYLRAHAQEPGRSADD
ncbi:hypothetical protein [Streptomyces hokutonensis]|uniref:hypothetical protein n=1 Tax=Streptomyces hokutonensis TaxID=1306990 RepID=UPI001319CD12|nr:hypothetical protein [Streptomyces hokutonensis]